MAVAIIYETHSLTVDNEAGVATGWLPGDSRQPVGSLPAPSVNAAVRALRRCSRPTSGARSKRRQLPSRAAMIPIFQDAWLRECNYGLLNGMPVARLPPNASQHIDMPYPDGQSYRQVVAAMRDFLRDLSARWDDTTGRHHCPLREQVGAR